MLSEGGISVIEALEVKEPKTKLFNQVLTSVLPERGKVLIVDDQFENNAALAARNIEGVSLSEAGNLSTLDVVRYRHIIVSSKGIETIIARANGGSEGGEVMISADKILLEYRVTEKAANSQLT